MKRISGQLQKSTSGIACAEVMKNSHSISKSFLSNLRTGCKRWSFSLQNDTLREYGASECETHDFSIDFSWFRATVLALYESLFRNTESKVEDGKTGRISRRSSVSKKRKCQDSCTPVCFSSKSVLIGSGGLMLENKLAVFWKTSVFGILQFWHCEKLQASSAAMRLCLGESE